jgi:hypothetical protein
MKGKKNACGRWIPEEINGQPVVPYQGVDKYVTTGAKAAKFESCTEKSRAQGWDDSLHASSLPKR